MPTTRKINTHACALPFLRIYAKGVNMITILEAAKKLEITKDKCRHWFKLLDIKPTKKGRTLFLSHDEMSLLFAMKKGIDAKLSPIKAAHEVKEVHATPERAIAPIQQEITTTNKKIADLEKAVLLLAEQNKTMLDTINGQTQKLSLIYKMLLPAPVKKVQVWQPQPPQRKKVSLLKRLWLELINPVALRA